MVETASFGSLEEAKQFADEVEAAIAADRWSGRRQGGQFTFGWVLDRYFAHRRPGSDARRQLDWWRSRLGSRGVGEISRRKVLELRRELAGEASRNGKRRSPATVNRYVSALSGVFSWALRKEYVDRHPIQGVEPLAERRAPLRVLSVVERRRLLESCRVTGGSRLEALVVLALSTGARRGELLTLRWSDLDLVRKRIGFPGKGRSRPRTLPLPDSAADLLCRLNRVRRIDCDLVFADVNGQVGFPRAAWRTAVDRSELDTFRFRDLRHTAAACLARSGATLAELAEILGTRTLQGVRRYADLTEERTPTAIERMQLELFQP